MKLSVIIIFFNNRREAPRTLYTLSRAYQRDIENLDYEVIAVDSNSPEPLETEMVESFGQEFNYHFVETPHPSPIEAMRRGLELSKGEYTMMIIDGAHMLTPNVFSKWQSAIKAYPNSFVYTQRYHLGKYRQNDNKGYNQSIEDVLLDSIDWKNDGYKLFKICHFIQSDEWWFSKHFESNCFIIPREKLIEHGSIHKDFFSTGGGFLNLAMFKKAAEDPELKTVILIGESTFHQFHGGTTTNVAREEVKLTMYKKEYFDLNQRHYGRPKKLDVHYFGNIDESEQRLLSPTKIQAQYREIARGLMLENKLEEAIFFIDRATELYPYSITLITEKVKIYKEQGRYDEAMDVLEKGLMVNQLDDVLLLLKGEVFLSQNNIDAATELFEFCHKLDESDPIPLMKLSKIHLKKEQPTIARQYIEGAVELVKELKMQNKFLAVFAFVKNNNYRVLAQKMLDFSDDITVLAHNFEFVLGKVEYLNQSPEKSKLTDELIDLYYNSKVTVNQSNRLGNLLVWQNRKEELRRLCKHLEKTNLPYQSHFLKAKWHLNHNNYDACLNEINIALPKAPTLYSKADCCKIEAKCYLKQKQFKACIVSINEAIEINPNNADLLFTKAKAHLGLKQDGQAKPLFERVAGISNYNLKFNALLHLFDIHFKKGNYKKCKSYLTEAAKVKPNHERIQRKQQKLVSTHK